MIFLQDILDGQLYKQCRGGVCSYYYTVNNEQHGPYATVQELVDDQAKADQPREAAAKTTGRSTKTTKRTQATETLADEAKTNAKK